MRRHAIVAERVMTGDGIVGDAVVIDAGDVIEVTSRERLGELPVVEHRGATVVPALIDSHLHPLGYASLVNGISLKEATGVDDLLSRIASVQFPGAIVAQRFDDTTLGRMPTRQDLDKAGPDRPVLAYRYCGHVAVANTAALDLAGIGPDTPDPAGGSFDRDVAGLPTGVLRETAIELVGAALDPLVAAPTDEAVLAALAGLVACGITRVTGIVAVSKPLWCGVGDELGTLLRLATELPLDIDVVVIAETPAELIQAAADVSAAGGRLRFWGWKDFADGSLGGHTAAMWAPFNDEPTTGTVRLDRIRAERLARTALDLGGVAAIHAIGDRAVDETLDVFDHLIAEGADPSRLRVEHLSVASDAAIGRLAATGVVGSIQPAFLSSEADWVPERLGRDRPAYRFATMGAAGVTLVAGSDCPVEKPDPLAGMVAAVGRRGWDDDEQVEPPIALSWFTAAPAAHLGLPEPLSAGAPADLVVVDGWPGGETATVRAVYRRGAAQTLRPVAWPG